MDFIIHIKDFLWDYVIIFLLVFAGLFFTIKLKFPQITKLGLAVKSTLGNVFKKDAGPKKEGEVSCFKRLPLLLQLSLVLDRLAVWLRPSWLVDRALYFGCGSRVYLACRRSLLRRFWLKSSDKRRTAKFMADLHTT